MPPRKRSSRRSPLSNLLIAIAVLGGLGATGFASANYLGWFVKKEPIAEKPTPKKPSRKGMIRVPKSLVALNAFEKVRREHIHDREKGDDSYFWLPKAAVESNPNLILNPGDIIGRVLARDKRPEFVFTEKDFLPRGSRTGLAAGVPVGKQGFFIQASLVPGLRLLKMGDQFDLMASVPKESSNSGSEYGLLMGGIKALGKKPIPVNGVRPLVQGGTVVALTDGKNMTTQGGMEFDSSSGEQIAIAIDPEEVVPLTQAIGSQLSIFAIARSGQQLEAAERIDQLDGLIPFPASAIEIKAYHRITAKDLTDAQTGQPRQYYFRPDVAHDNWIDGVDKLLGRVVRRDVDPGYIFSESDLLPTDSVINNVAAYSRIEADDLADPSNAEFIGRVAAMDLLPGQILRETSFLPPDAAPGIAGGIPPSKMAVTVSAEQISGLGALARGDRFDIITSAPINLQQRLGGNIQLVGTDTSKLSDRAVNAVIATEALIVQQDGNSITLAVYPDEVAALTKALALKTPIFTIARSGRSRRTNPDSQSEGNGAIKLPPLESDPDPLTDIVVRESISGSDRKVMAFRQASEQ